MRPSLALPVIAMAILSAGCDRTQPDGEPAVPPVTTDTDLTAPVNEAASNEAVIPVVPNPPTP